jgi:hypothetical protein
MVQVFSSIQVFSVFMPNVWLGDVPTPTSFHPDLHPRAPSAQRLGPNIDEYLNVQEPYAVAVSSSGGPHNNTRLYSVYPQVRQGPSNPPAN